MKRMPHCTVILFALLVGIPSLLLADECTTARTRYQQAVETADYHQKATLYREAVRLCPTYAEAHNNLADALEHLGQYDAAIAAYQQAIALKPDLAVSYFGLGDTYLSIGLFKQAAEAYEGGLRFKPTDPHALTSLRIARQGVPSAQTLALMDAATIIAHLKDTTIKTMGPGGVRQRQSRLRFHNILFDFDAARLRTDAIPQVHEIGKALSSPALQGVTWIIEGHTDSVGREAYNDDLSRQRAASVKSYLTAKFALHEEMLRIAGYGERRPIADNRTPMGQQQNRRVEIVAIHREAPMAGEQQ